MSNPRSPYSYYDFEGILRSIARSYSKTLALYDTKMNNLSYFIDDLKHMLDKPIEPKDLPEFQRQVLGSYSEAYDLTGYIAISYTIAFESSQITDKVLEDLYKKMNSLVQDPIALGANKAFHRIHDKLNDMIKLYVNKIETGILERFLK